MAGIEFRVLGPVEILRDGQRLGPTTPQQRCVLAVLLLDLGHVVSIGRLVSALWAADPPASARNSLRVYVTKLRKLLAADPEIGLVTVGDGWRLDCDPARVDLYRFRALVEQARNGAGAEAGPRLREALALWQGPSLADASGDALTGALVEGLEDERLAAVEDRIAWDLESGAGQAVAPELSVLVAEHPLRERLTQLLMSALHASGRTAEGLAAFHRTRRRLVEELGIEPSAVLRAEHQRLLAASGDAGAAVVAGPLPQQLPGDVSVFAGRADQLSRLDGLLEDAEREDRMLIAAVAGIPGSGKTTLAVHWAHRVKDRFPDGQLYLNLRGFEATGEAVAPGDALARFLEALGVATARIPAETDARSALYRSVLARRRVLIVLDNARDEAQVRPLLPGSTGCAVVVTGRTELAGLAARRGAHLLALDVFDRAEARDLLVGRLGPARVAEEPEAVARIIDRCAGLALSLTMVAARAGARADFSLSSLAAELDSGEVVLDAFASADASVDLRTVFSWSYLQLSPEAARLFRLLGLHRGPDAGLGAVASLAGIGAPAAGRLLRELCRMRLVAEHAPGRFDLHDLLAAYAAELGEALDAPSVRRAALGRLLDHCLHTAHAAADLVAPHRSPIPIGDPDPGAQIAAFGDDAAATAWFAAERHVLTGAVAAAFEAGFDDHVWQLAQCLATYLRREGMGADWLATQRLARSAADRLGQTRAQAVTGYGLAAAQIRYGDPQDAEANLLAALRYFEELGDLDWQGNTFAMLCLGSEAVGDYAAALAYAVEGLERHRRAGYLPGQARALNNVGHCRARLGDFDRALRDCREALELLVGLDDPVGEGNALDSLGFIHSRLGEFDLAIECYRRSFASLHLRGERYLAAVTLHRLGDAHVAVGDRGAALEVWKRALGMFEALRHPDASRVRAKLIALPPRPVR
ncbi:AfsR/SARP family transcriptional regulator [Glycomyces dulcitolivorans]|uniref:AfsR/SARP family transcriptional regulator n=1 Tax=Glycomyces dulcitolivorans TaxID=2200759 RepID=UPI0018E5972F|nr:BTAD domain-containing putative transcriptional regulator [Glycomyces dulcitolivorans]